MAACEKKARIAVKLVKPQHFHHDDPSHQREKDTDKQENGICAFVHIS
ncbi:MAG: hypothetical protein KBA05_01805 [Anaerolineaceae bacterium]|jgi:hypothetical protein|nr:hypothetical protein [Anaerolineaceae bacterium]MDI9531131.1 hypothetical protein [Chloroflexota bacterium]NLE93259.1 hypothetical protein [Chloroflexota bacterium]HOF28087.1 hypothetical protein [Anaerolineaceae bacterium]